MSTALAWLLTGLAVLDPAQTSTTTSSLPTVLVEAPATDDYPGPPAAAPMAPPAVAIPASARPVAARTGGRTPRSDSRAGERFRPTVAVAVASGVGLAGVTLGGLGAGLETERGLRGFSAVALGVGAAAFATAGVLLLVGGDHERATQVAIGPAAVQVRRSF